MKLLQRKLCIAMGLVAAPAAVPAMAQQSPEDIPPPPPGNGLTELSDEEMGDMRGRYTVGHDTVAWFGVTMVSTWQTQAGQTMQGKVTMGIDLSQPDRPKVTFQPHVSITAANAPSPAPSGERNIDHVLYFCQIRAEFYALFSKLGQFPNCECSANQYAYFFYYAAKSVKRLSDC